jgi:hypothetical protein
MEKKKTVSMAKPKPKPKPKVKPKEKEKVKEKEKPKPKTSPRPKQTRKKGGGITIICDNDEGTCIDQYYERKITGIVKKIKEQNSFTDDKIRFGWNNS